MELQFGEIKDYYQRNFGSGPRLYQHFRDQIAREVATLGLNWQAVEDGLSWQASVKFRANSAKFFLNRKGFKTHAIYANYRTIGPISNGIEVPMISVASRGQEQADYVFDGWAELKQLAESDRGLVDLSARQKSRLDDAAKKMEQRAAKAAAKAAIEAIEREQARVNDVADFLKLSPLQESGYLDKKRLWAFCPTAKDSNRAPIRTADLRPFRSIPSSSAPWTITARSTLSNASTINLSCAQTAN